MKTFLKWLRVVLSNLIGIVLVPIPVVLMTLFIWALQIINREWPLVNTWRIFRNAAITIIGCQIAWAKGDLS